MKKEFKVGDCIYHIGHDMIGTITKDESNKYSEVYDVEFTNEYGYKQNRCNCSAGLMVKHKNN